MNPGAAMPWARASLGLLRYLRIVPPRRVALDMTHTSQGPALLLWHKAVALEFLPMGAQLLLKAALPLAGILATASDRCRKTGPLQTPASIGNNMTSQSRKDLRRCVLSHWRFIQLSLRIVMISHWMLLHNSWTLYVSTNPSIYLHVYVVYFPRNGRIQRPHLRSVNVSVTSSWTFCFAGTTTRCSFGINY